jgi:hypothetical protein
MQSRALWAADVLFFGIVPNDVCFYVVLFLMSCSFRCCCPGFGTQLAQKTALVGAPLPFNAVDGDLSRYQEQFRTQSILHMISDTIRYDVCVCVSLCVVVCDCYRCSCLLLLFVCLFCFVF